MARRIDFSDEQTKKIVELFEENTPIKTIARKIGVSYKPIVRVLREKGLLLPETKPDNGPRIDYQNLTKEQKQIIIDNYVLQGQGIKKAGSNFNCSERTVQKVLKDAGVKLRTYAESKDAIRVYNYNDDYFKTQTCNMAYILGFLAADGYVAKNENSIKIEILSNDKEILEKIRIEVSSNRPLVYHIRKNTGHETVSWLVNSRTWKQDLAKYGIVNKKTFILEPPTFLSSKYYADFIRGYFDGDGNFYFKPSSYKNALCIVGASKKIMTWFKDVLINQYGIVTKFDIKLDSYKKPMYYLYIYDRQMLYRIYNLFYSTDSNLYLKRKKEAFDKFIEYFHETSILQKEE